MKRVISILFLVTAMIFTICSPAITVYAEDRNDEYSALGGKLSSYEGNSSEVRFMFSSEEEMYQAMQSVCRNGRYELRFSPETLAVAVADNQSGAIFTSNPYNAAGDKNYTGDIAKNMNSQVIVTYLDSNVKEINLWSSTDCVELGQYTVDIYENGIAVHITIGKEKENTFIPVIFSAETYKKVSAKLTERMQKRMDYCYEKYSAAEISDTDFAKENKDFVPQEVYYCPTELTDREKRDISSALNDAGYTYEDYCSDLESMGLEPETESSPFVKLDLLYILTENGLEARIPNSSIEYDPNYPLTDIVLLPYFGADEPVEGKNGYLFIPDGSGAVISFTNQDNNRRRVISGRIYGDDGAVIPKDGIDNDSLQYYLPVYGIVRNNGTAFFAEIAEGSENAEISAFLGEPNGRYYTVRPKFSYTNCETYTRSAKTTTLNSSNLMYLYDENHTKSSFSVKYYFLDEDMASYSGMAEIYRKQLEKSGMKTEKKITSYINLQTIGSALAEKSFLGFDYEAETVFTSFSDDEKIIEELYEQGISNISLTLAGWQKNGLDASVSSKMRISSKLGGKSGLRSLIEKCRERNVFLTLENEFTFVEKDRLFDGFWRYKDGVRTLDGSYASYKVSNPANSRSVINGYYVSAYKYSDYFERLIKDFSAYDVDYVSMGMLGSSLNCDYSGGENSCNRTQAVETITDMLESYGETGGLSFTGANAYVIPYADTLSGIPYTNSGYLGETASVPFLQLVVNGGIECHSNPVNLEGDLRQQLLYCLQSATVPTFTVAYGNVSLLKVTEHTEYFSVDYGVLKEQIKESCNFLKEAYSAIDGSSMISHEIIADGVSMTKYENDVCIYVNFNDTEAYAGEIKIPAENYVIYQGVSEK